MSLKTRKDFAVKQPTAAPTNKTLAGVVSGGVAVVIAFAFQYFTGIEFPPAVEGGIATTVYGVIAYLVPDMATLPPVVVVVEDEEDAER